MSGWNGVRAVAKREWSSYFNSPVAYVFIVIFLVLSGVFTFVFGNFYEARQANLDTFFLWHPWLYVVLVPAAAMRLWSEERRSGTIELLLTLPLTPAQAILGKFLAAWAFLLLALALTFPMVITTYYLGDPDPGTILTGYLASGLLSGAYLAVGMLTSALTRNQVIAFVLAVLAGLFLLLLGFAPLTHFVSRFAPMWLVDGLAALSFLAHFQNLQRGVIDLADLAYFAGVMGFALVATHAALATRTGK